MQTIIRRSIVAVVIVISAGVAACSGASPTSATFPPAEARAFGGITFGSGNVVGTPSSPNTTAADSGSTAGRGITFGSGN
jgi:hypothetical protein